MFCGEFFVAETSKNIKAYDLMLAYYYLGNTEKALEYARKADRSTYLVSSVGFKRNDEYAKYIAEKSQKLEE